MTHAQSKPTVLFLCTGNSCRSQMAEGFAKQIWADRIHAESAGTSPHGMNPLAMKVMAEAGADISSHHSKHLDELSHLRFDYVFTVCGHAHETCPVFPGHAKIIHVGFDDPPKLAKGAKNEAEAFDCYRRVRDEIRKFIKNLPNYVPELAQR
jgi:arsenate reductase (thioredoxin)